MSRRYASIISLLALALPALAEPPPPLPPGRYGMLLETATRQKLPFLGETPGGGRNWMLVEVSEEQGRLVHRARVCEMRITGEKGADGRVEVPATFVAALPAVRAVAELQPPAQAGDRWQFSLDLGLEHLGYDPALSPRGAPTDPAHPAVRDHEGDGQPGATMRLSLPVLGKVEIYVVQRSHISLHGTIESPGIVRGGVRYHAFEQITLGASNRLFATSPEMQPDPSRSRFSLQPIPATVDCAGLRRYLCQQGEGCDQ